MGLPVLDLPERLCWYNSKLCRHPKLSFSLSLSCRKEKLDEAEELEILVWILHVCPKYAEPIRTF